MTGAERALFAGVACRQCLTFKLIERPGFPDEVFCYGCGDIGVKLPEHAAGMREAWARFLAFHAKRRAAWRAA